VRSLPFFPSDEAPWYQTIIKSNGTAQTGFLWTAGNVATNPNNQYPYAIPPYLSVINDTIYSRQSYGKRSNTNQYSSGYLQYTVQEDTFLSNVVSVTLNGQPFPMTTRTARYQFTVTGYPYLANTNFLRLSIMVGVGPTGNDTLAVAYLANVTSVANATSATGGLPSYIISENTADWTIVLPQNLQDPGAVGGVSDAPLTCEYNPLTQIIFIYLPYSLNVTTQKSNALTYTFFLIYEYFTPPLPSTSVQDGGGTGLLPLWIVLGVLGGLVIIAIIILIIVGIVVYVVIKRKYAAYEIEENFGKTEGALGGDRSAF